MVDGNRAMPARGHRPGARGDRTVDRLLEHLVETMTAMEDGRQPVSALDPVATPLAARRIQSIVLATRAARRRTAGARPRTVPTIVRTSCSFHPTAGVTEGVVLVRQEQRTRAYCVRLEQDGADWRVVELAPPDTSLLPVVTRASREGRHVPIAPEAPGTRRPSVREPIDGVDRDVMAGSDDGEDEDGDGQHEGHDEGREGQASA